MKLLRPFPWVSPILAILAALPGCSSYSEVRQIAPIFQQVPIVDPVLTGLEGSILKAGKTVTKDPMAALGSYMTAAKASSDILAHKPGDQRAMKDYNFAVARIVSTIGSAKLDPWNQPLSVPGENGGFILTRRPDPRPNWNPALYDFTPADQFDLGGTYVTDRTVHEGLGAPAVAVGKEANQFAEKNFTMQKVYYGVTAIATFKGNRCEIGFEDPLASDTVSF